MNVLMLNPSGSAFGYVHSLCNALAAQGARVRLLTSPAWERDLTGLQTVAYDWEPAFYRRTFFRSQDAGPMRPLWRGLRLAEHAAGWEAVRRAAREADVVHVQWLPVPELDVAPLHALARRRPIAYTAHNLLPHDAAPTLARRALWRAIYAAPHAILAHTNATVRALHERFGVRQERLTRVEHGSFDYLLEHGAPRAPAPAPTVLGFGFIGPYKGVDVLLRALPAVRRAVPGARVAIVGRPRGPLAPILRLVTELGLDDAVELRTEHVPEADLGHVFGAAHVVALPYRAIAQSGVAITACTFGKALVASDVGGLGELVREAENGLLVPPGDPEALAEALVRVLTDHALRATFEARSRRHAEGPLAWAPIAERTLAAYARARDAG
ncbi:MAG: glycosyltransferase family 1 protein [Deltaproteobacteria bacterium]|nr:MAG: glycosyltransferase family 1 protein [Deltaproteobacteria bacterium]